MTIDFLIRKILEFSQTKIMRFFFQFFEHFIFWYYNVRFKKTQKINSKFFSFFQFFHGAKIAALYRRRKHEILTEKLDLSLERDKKINELTNKSYAKLFDLNSLEVKNTVEYFYKQKIHTSHVPTDLRYYNKLISVDEFLNVEDPNYNYGSFDIGISLNSNVVKKICSMEKIWSIARKYLQSDEVKIYSINTMLTKKSKKKNYVVNLHVDFDSASMLTVFIYWTDVSELNGATRVLPGSHLFLHDRRLGNYVREPSTKYLEGKSGSVFALDTWALHAGNSNITSPRLVTWIRFSSLPVSGYYSNRNYLFKKNLDEVNDAKKL